MLREQLGILAETQRTLNTQTTQLVSALAARKRAGSGARLLLRRLVELAGMSSRCDFTEQTPSKTKMAASGPTWSSTCRASG